MLFRCKNCGGNAIFSPLKGKMFCPHCDGIDSEEKESKGMPAECANCGASLTITEYNSTCKCEYCGSYIILEDRVEGEYRPNLLIPFKMDKKNVVDMLREEFRSRIFTPASFLSEATLEEMKGLYVPFWMYDYGAECNFAGKGTKVRVWTSGDTEYTETSYYRVERDLNAEFDKIPVDASFQMKDDIMDLLEPYDYKQLEEFQEKYMSGFYGEIYNEGAEVLGERAEKKVDNDVDSLLNETLGGYSTVIPEYKTINKKQEAVYYSLLPVWCYKYKYKEKDYDFHVNGQTGKIIGSTPVSKAKVLAYGSTVLAAMGAICFMVARIVEVI